MKHNIAGLVAGITIVIMGLRVTEESFAFDTAPLILIDVAISAIATGFGLIITIASISGIIQELRSCYMKLTPKDTDKIYYLIICFFAIYFMYHIGRYLVG